MLSSLRNYLLRINAFLGKIEIGLLCIIVAMMVGLAVLEIILRYIFNESLLWKHHMLQNLTLWMCFLGAALASSERRHISIDVLRRILPENVMRYISIVIDVLSLIVVSILAYYGFGFLKDEQQLTETLIGSIPMWWAKTIIPIGFILIGIHIFLQLIINLISPLYFQMNVEGETD